MRIAAAILLILLVFLLVGGMMISLIGPDWALLLCLFWLYKVANPSQKPPNASDTDPFKE